MSAVSSPCGSAASLLSVPAPAASSGAPARHPSRMHLLLVRHAESSNNVLAEAITQEMGIDPYAPNSGAVVLAEYDRRRTADPDLSPLGQKQAELLPQHPHLLDIHFAQLVAEGRVRVVTSPMQRTILTSLPLLAAVQPKEGEARAPLRAQIVPDVCEKGGSYISVTDAAGDRQNKAIPGHGRAELERRWGATHDASGIPESGWWACPCPGAEDEEAFQARIGRAHAWLMGIVSTYGAAPLEQPDYLMVVAHADFIDAFLTSLLQLPENHAKYVFYSANTSISHLEFEVQAEGPPAVRVRGTNIKPCRVEAHELAVHRRGNTKQQGNTSPQAHQ